MICLQLTEIEESRLRRLCDLEDRGSSLLDGWQTHALELCDLLIATLCNHSDVGHTIPPEQKDEFLRLCFLDSKKESHTHDEVSWDRVSVVLSHMMKLLATEARRVNQSIEN